MTDTPLEPLHGFTEGQMLIIAGCSRMGKTAFTQQMLDAAYRHNLSVVIAAESIRDQVQDLDRVFSLAAQETYNFGVAMEASEPQRITYGPQRKGKGGKVKKW